MVMILRFGSCSCRERWRLRVGLAGGMVVLVLRAVAGRCRVGVLLIGGLTRLLFSMVVLRGGGLGRRGALTWGFEEAGDSWVFGLVGAR